MHLSSRLPSLGLMKLCSHAGEVVAYKVQQVQYYKFVWGITNKIFFQYLCFLSVSCNMTSGYTRWCTLTHLELTAVCFSSNNMNMLWLVPTHKMGQYMYKAIFCRLSVTCTYSSHCCCIIKESSNGLFLVLLVMIGIHGDNWPPISLHYDSAAPCLLCYLW